MMTRAKLLPFLLPYMRLMRLEKPIGTWLIFFPALMGLSLVNSRLLISSDLIIFSLGSLIIRSAGCVLNDILDAKFDRKVTRTKSRPLAAGDLTKYQAWICLGILLAGALMLVPFLNPSAILMVPLALVLAATYPMMKRLTFMPQVYLGFCMNFSFLFAIMHASGSVSLQAIVIYIGLCFWTIAYDTVYAHGDKHDDVKVGVKSLALHPLGKTKAFLQVCYGLCFLCIAAALPQNITAMLILSLLWLWRFFVIEKTNLETPALCLKIFKSEIYTGLGIWLAILVAT